VHEEDRERVEAAEEAANTTSSYLEEYRLLTADDRVVWVRDEAVYVPATERRPGHWIGLIIDITREKEAETRAAEVEQRYRTLIEQLPIVTYIDAPDETLTNIYVSPQINDLLGAALRIHGRRMGGAGPSGRSRAGAARNDRGRSLRCAVHPRVSDGP
jgi:PAS domain-containing protein